MDIKEMKCTLKITQKSHTVNTFEYTGEKAVLELAKAYRDLNRETRFPSVARASRECNPYARRTTITVKYQPIGDNMPLTYTYTFNFNDKTDF